jgi:stromal membrane-associated protein
VEPVAPQQPAETSKPATDTAQSTPPKVDYATDLFNMLSMDDQNENGSKAAGATADDINWAGFQCMSVSLKKKKEKKIHYFNTIIFCSTICFGRFGEASEI